MAPATTTNATSAKSRVSKAIAKAKSSKKVKGNGKGNKFLHNFKDPSLYQCFHYLRALYPDNLSEDKLQTLHLLYKANHTLMNRWYKNKLSKPPTNQLAYLDTLLLSIQFKEIKPCFTCGRFSKMLNLHKNNHCMPEKIKRKREELVWIDKPKEARESQPSSGDGDTDLTISSNS